jgi:uncharacterized low-complexity protein
MTMSKTNKLFPVTAAIGTAFAVNLSVISLASAGENPFASQVLANGYQLAEHHEGKGEGKCGEGKCGAGMKKPAGEGKCGEGKCGMSRMDGDKDGSITKVEFIKAHEEMFTKMDADGDGKVTKEEIKSHRDGKCGEGKCGGNKS